MQTFEGTATLLPLELLPFALHGSELLRGSQSLWTTAFWSWNLPFLLVWSPPLLPHMGAPGRCL